MQPTIWYLVFLHLIQDSTRQSRKNEIEDIIDLTHLSDNEDDTNSTQLNIFLDPEAIEDCPPPPKRGRLNSA